MLNRPLLIFYLLAGYILLFVVWWIYHLQDIHKELAQLQVAQAGDMAAYYMRNYDRKLVMVYSEGAAFLLVLLLGIWQVRNSFSREIRLANQQKNFLLSITHELRSPLASIKLILQTIYKRDMERPKVEELSQAATADVDRLQNLVDNMLLAAQLEDSNYVYDKELLDLSELTREMAERSVLPYEGKWTLDMKIDPGITIRADALSMSSLILNLMDNALKYSEAGSSIRVQISESGSGPQLEIADQGAGVPEEERERIFRRFYRLGREETRKAKGTGIGLYIVKTVAEAHDATVECLPNSPRGSVFRVRFKHPED